MIEIHLKDIDTLQIENSRNHSELINLKLMIKGLDGMLYSKLLQDKRLLS